MYPTYVQRKLSPFAPPEAAPSDSKPIQFVIVLGVKDGRVALEFEQLGAGGQDYIAITQDSMVEIILRGDQLYFSKELDAITTKDELASFYGGLVYDGYDKELDRYQIVRFCARYNQGGKSDTIHGFNVNVDFLQVFDAQDPKWIALTIDPDIKNPPPDHN